MGIFSKKFSLMQNVFPGVTTPNMVQCTVPFTCLFSQTLASLMVKEKNISMQDEIKVSGLPVRH